MLYIETIYKEGSFSRAAQKLFVTQPALSAAVKRVESGMGEAIFDRTSRPLALTEAGEIYMEQIRRIAAVERETAVRISDLSRLRRGKIRIGATTYFNACVLPPVLKIFSDAYPNVDVHLLENNSALLKGRLQDGDVDVIFTCQQDDPALYASTEIFRDFILLAVPEDLSDSEELRPYALTADMVAARAHLDGSRPSVPLIFFADTPFLLLTEGNNLNARAGLLFQQAGFRPKVKMYVEQLMTAYQLSRAGIGATFASAQIIQGAPAGEMRYFKLASPLTIRRFRAICCKGRYVPHAVRELIRVMRDFYMG